MNHHSFRHLLRCAFLGISLITLFSCPSPLTKDMLVQVKDEVGPNVTILSPEDGNAYASAVIVEGMVTDSSDSGGTEGGIKRLYYEFTPAVIDGADVDIGEDGTFSFQFFTDGFTDSILVTVTAEDWNGNTGSASFTLVDAGAIPSFTATAGNGEVTLNWDPVALAESYTVYYETADIIPNSSYSTKMEEVTSPLTITGLTNGSMHTFLLQSNSSDGEDNWSEVEKAIPLSEFHLAPRLSSNYDSILIEWNTIPEIEEYQVWKSSSEEGRFINISGNIQRDYFLDTAVEPETSYWYSIRAGNYNDNLSEAADGRLRGIPENDERLLRTIGGFDYSYDIAVSGDIACLADGYNGLHIFDLSDPEEPVRTATFNTPGYCTHVEIAGDYAYVTDDSRDASITIFDSGLRIINIANPYSPVEVGSVDTTSAAESVKIKGNYAYVATPGGVAIVDISNKSDPQEKSFYEPSLLGLNNIECLYIVDTDLFIGTSTDFRITDISTPTEPTGDDKSATASVSEMVVAGDYAYTASSTDIRVFDLNAGPPFPIVTTYDMSSYPSNFDTVGSYLYVTDSSEGLTIFDIHDPPNPVKVGSCNTRGHASAVQVKDNIAYISDGDGGFAVADIRNPAFASKISEDTDYSDALGIAVKGDTLYVADSNNGIKIYRITNPENPDQLGEYPVGCSYLVVRGNYAYVTGDNGFEVVDISNPASPQQCSSVDISPDSLGITMKGHIVFVAGQTDGLVIIDVSDPYNAFEIKTIPPADTAVNDVRLKGNYLYSMESTLFRVFDLENPESPSEIGRAESLSTVFSIDFYDNYGYITDLMAGLRIFDITHPFNMSEVGVYGSGSINPVSVEIYGSYAFVTDYYNGLSILDISDPSAPFELKHLDTGGLGRGVYPFDEYLYYTNGSGGLQVIDLW